MENIRHLLKKGDIVLIGLLLLFTVASFFIFRFSAKKGRQVTILVDNKEQYRFSLSDDHDASIEGAIGATYIRIREGFLWITEAPCPHKDCMRMGKISHAGEIIVCIPNKILIKVEGEVEDTLDGITM